MNEFATVCKHILDCGAIIDRIGVRYNDEVLQPCSSVWSSNEKQLVKLFLSAGASIGIDRFGWTPLHHLACEFEADHFDDEAIRLLQDAGVDINAIDNGGRTVLDIAARLNMRRRGSEGTIQRLKALGARANEALRDNVEGVPSKDKALLMG
jgi:ankyrin repeat protein